MTPRSLFNIILKIFGLFFLKEIIVEVFQFLTQFLYLIKTEVSFNGIPMIIAGILFILFYGLICYQLLIKTNSIIDKLKLDEGFSEQEFSFNISVGLILMIGIVIIAGVILVNEIPNFCRQFYKYFDDRRFRADIQKPDLTFMILSGTKIIVALLLIGERNTIVKYLEKRNKSGQASD